MKLIDHNLNPTPISPSPSSSSHRSSDRLRRLRAENVRHHVPLGMRLRRVPANIIPRFQSSSGYPKPIMASEGGREDQPGESQKKGVEEKEKEKEKEKVKSVELPPAPEKPLPGDCCGSGCVRCVWDVYYEELEEYNKLCEKGSATKS